MTATVPVHTAPVHTEPLLGVHDLRVEIASPRGIVHAINGVSLQLERGETLALVGESGSGKSMLVRSLMGILPPRSSVTGSARLDGADLVGMPEKQARTIWGSRIGMVFQDPMTSLNPVVRVGRQISEGARRHLGLSRAEARLRAVELLRQVGIPEPERRVANYPHEFSGGMRQRVCIAMALACEPDILIADESTTALDVTVQNQILNLIQNLQRQRNMAVILVSHDLGVVASRSDRVAVMYGGRIVETADTAALFAAPRHPYTRALLDAIPHIGGQPHSRLAMVPGLPPDLAKPITGCAFAPRCAAVTEHCRSATFAPLPLEDPHAFACLNPVPAPQSAVESGVSP